MKLITVLYLTILAANSLGKRFVCYYGSWSVYRHGPGKFAVEDIDPTLCTHLIYAFAGLGDNGKVRILDPYNDIGDEWHEGAFTKLRKLRNINPELKIMLAIGGWNEGSERYSRVTNDPSLRKIFVNSILNVTLTYDFDGFDLDWEYPNERGGRPSDKQAFSALIRDVKTLFQPRRLLLSAAVTANALTAPTSYECRDLIKYLDFINIMTYDLHGGWDRVTGHHTGLYKHPKDTEYQKHLNVDSAIKYWIKCTGAPEKLNIGLAAYGRTFTLANAQDHGVGAPATGPGPAGSYVGEGGFLGYNEICMEQRKNLWKIYKIPEQDVKYAVKGNIWLGYDDVESITTKVKYAKNLGLGGAMIWSIETDDFKGECGNGKYPLLKTVLKVLNIPPPSTTIRPSSTTTSPSTTSTVKQTTVWPSTTSTIRPTTVWSSTTSTVRPTMSQAPTYTTTNRPTSTSTQSPTTTDGSFDSLCQYVGHMFKHPFEKSSFFICTYKGVDYLLRAVQMYCPRFLVFDEEAKVCNFPKEDIKNNLII